MTTSRQRYEQSEKGRARRARYARSEHGRAVRAKWEREHREYAPAQYAEKLLKTRRRKALMRREERRARGQVQG